jgi:hypothetical protein
MKPNVKVKLLKLVFRIREVLGLNLGPESSYNERIFRGFPQSLQVNEGRVP